MKTNTSSLMDSHLVDFTNPNATKWWTNSASNYHDIVPFEGIWIDMV